MSTGHQPLFIILTTILQRLALSSSLLFRRGNKDLEADLVESGLEPGAACLQRCALLVASRILGLGGSDHAVKGRRGGRVGFGGL